MEAWRLAAWCGAEAYPGHRQPLVLNALDGCGLEGAVTHVWAQHQVGVGSDHPPLHCPSNDSPHSRNTKSLINDELSILLHLVMPACITLTIYLASQQHNSAHCNLILFAHVV